MSRLCSRVLESVRDGSVHHGEIQSPGPWEAATPVMRDQKPSVLHAGESITRDLFLQQQGFPPGKLLVAPAVVLSHRGMLVEFSALEEKG